MGFNTLGSSVAGIQQFRVLHRWDSTLSGLYKHLFGHGFTVEGGEEEGDVGEPADDAIVEEG